MTRALTGPSKGPVRRTQGTVADPTIGVPALMARDHGPSAYASRERHSHSAFDRLPTSPNIPGRRIPVYGSKTSSSPIEPEEWMMITSSFSTSPSAWGNMFERGSNSSRMTASVTGRISRGSSSGISRGRMSVLGIPRTSRVASRSPASPYGTTSVGSPNDATPSLMSSTRTSSAHSSPGQRASP